MPPLATPPGFTEEYLEWALSQPRLFDDPGPDPPTEPPTEPDKPESGKTKSDKAECDKTEYDAIESHRTKPDRTKSDRTVSDRTESDKAESDGPVHPDLGPPGAPCDFNWNRFKRPLSEWQAGLEAIYKPYSDEAWSVCTTEEWLYGVLHARLVTRFERNRTVPTEQEAKEVHVICMLAKYYLIKREEMGQAHLPIYVEEALSDAIIKLTMYEIDFTE